MRRRFLGLSLTGNTRPATCGFCIQAAPQLETLRHVPGVGVEVAWIFAEHRAPCGQPCEMPHLDRGLESNDSCPGQHGTCEVCRRDRRRRGVSTGNDEGFTDPGRQLPLFGL